jgi:hypothetical protein
MGENVVKTEPNQMMYRHFVKGKKIEFSIKGIRNTTPPEGWSNYDAYELVTPSENRTVLLVGSEGAHIMDTENMRGSDYFVVMQIPKSHGEEIMDMAQDMGIYQMRR